MNTRVLSVVGLLLITACSYSVHPSSDYVAGDAENAIRARNRTFMAGVAAGNVNEMMTIYSEEAVLLPPNAPAQRGPAAIRQFWTGFLATGKFTLNLIPDDIQQSCDMATEIGRYEVTVVPAGTTATVKDGGKYVVSWRKVNGEWRAFADIFNSDAPAFAAR